MIFCDGRPTENFEAEVKIKKNIHDGIFPSWILDIHYFLKDLDLKYTIINSDKVCVDILHVPKELKNTILMKTKELGLIFEILGIQKMMYEGGITRPIHRVYGMMESMNYSIREPIGNEDINEICYRLESR